jgi:hypothetical protein
MRSLDSRREILEGVLRTASICLLGWMLWSSLHHDRTYKVNSARSADLMRALREWTLADAEPADIHVQLDSTPSPLERDWLAALRAAGSRVSWGGALPALGVDVQPVAAPHGGLAVLVAAPSGATVVLSDRVGVIDSSTARDGGARFTIAAANAGLVARAAGSRARAPVPTPSRVRRVLVLGAAGWESKFVVAALEEDGWTVDAVLHVAPNVDVTQGAAGAIDTSRYSAVIALDSTAAPRAAQVVRFVASGGGLILVGSAATIGALAPVRVGTGGRMDPATVRAGDAGPTTLQTLAAAPLTGLADDAVVLSRRGGAVMAAARRHVGGRVLQLGYEDDWRWRMAGGETSVADHRAWWTRAVASVAYTPRADSVPRRTNADGFAASAGAGGADQAPVASLIGAIGPASAGAIVVGERRLPRTPASWLFALLAFCLLAEWTSRRSRGAR